MVFVWLHTVFAPKIHPEDVKVIGTLKEIGAGYAPTPCPIKFESPLCAVGFSLTVRRF